MARPGYIPVPRPWTWNTASPAERADAIRAHQRKIGSVATAELFQLTEAGIIQILNGDVWRPEYATP